MKPIADMTGAVLADPVFSQLRDHIIAVTGLEYYAGRECALADQIAHRLSELDVPQCSGYLQLLRSSNSGESELDKLIARLTIGETHFFRHRELFDALRDVALPEILERNRTSKRLRIWSAGCSTGAEAYSLSILLRREMRSSFEGWNISIVGTDINRPFLAQAAAGQYDNWAFRGTTADFRRQCFEEVVDEKSWRLAPAFQKGVGFHYHNLVRNPFPSMAHGLVAFDIILCRNVLIYFATDVAQRTISQFAECLVPGGWLAVGHAENGGQFYDDFDTINLRGATLHRKPVAAIRPPSLKQKERQPLRSDAQYIRLRGTSTVDPTVVVGGPHLHEYTSAQRGCKRQLPAMSAELERMHSLADHGDVDTALDLCYALSSREPGNAALYFYIGLLLDQAARNKAAVDALTRAICLDRGFVFAHYYLGLVLQKSFDVCGASKSFRNALRLLEHQDPTSSLPHAAGLKAGDLSELARMHLESLLTL